MTNLSLEPVVAPLIGCWQLLSCSFEVADGGVTHPFGEKPEGLLIYTQSGWMSVQIMRVNRPEFDAGFQLGGLDAEVRAAFEGYNAYYGRFEVDVAAGLIVHRAVGNLYPNGIGTERRRFYTLDRDQLILKTPPMRLDSAETIGTIIWQRIG
jgi:hypothetical protein